MSMIVNRVANLGHKMERFRLRCFHRESDFSKSIRYDGIPVSEPYAIGCQRGGCCEQRYIINEGNDVYSIVSSISTGNAVVTLVQCKGQRGLGIMDHPVGGQHWR